jgi:hypothetical protein
MHKNTKGVQVCRIKEDDKVIFANVMTIEDEDSTDYSEVVVNNSEDVDEIVVG